MRVLGIESSCDETAAAVYDDSAGLLSSIVSSQVAVHGAYGGVVPELASREHLKSIVPGCELGTTPPSAPWTATWDETNVERPGGVVVDGGGGRLVAGALDAEDAHYRMFAASSASGERPLDEKNVPRDRPRP